MKRTVYLTAAAISALTACKPTTVVVGNNTTAAASTTANIAVNEQGVDNNVTSTGAIDVNGAADANNAATNEAVPPTTNQ